MKFKTTKVNSGSLFQLFTKISTHESHPLYGILDYMKKVGSYQRPTLAHPDGDQDRVIADGQREYPQMG